MTPLLVNGMMGLGDCIHQRAVIRQLMERNEVWLQTPWPSLYADLAGEGLILLPAQTTLRTQAKNIARQAALFADRRPTAGMRVIDTLYRDLRHTSFLGAMLKKCGCDLASADFRLPVDPEAERTVRRMVRAWHATKPLLVYRPLVERGEWGACAARNPDHAAYARLFNEIAPDFFTVSIADLDGEHEYMVGERVKADVECHLGEFDVETLAALMANAALVYCSPGFALIMAQAVGTPVIAVFGGHENARHYIDTVLYAPFLGINPMVPCSCFSEEHACQKAINLARALPEVRRFAAMARRDRPTGPRPQVRLSARIGQLPQPDGFMGLGEIETIIELVGSVRPKRVIEFGVNAGRTARAILTTVPGIERYIGIDVPPGFSTALAVQRGEVDAAPGHLVAGDARLQLMILPHGSHDLAVGDLPACDAAFIDGDHSRAGVLHDTALAKAAVRPGGIVIWHDDHDLGTVDVRAVLDEMHAYGEATAVHVEGTWLAFELV